MPRRTREELLGRTGRAAESGLKCKLCGRTALSMVPKGQDFEGFCGEHRAEADALMLRRSGAIHAGFVARHRTRRDFAIRKHGPGVVHNPRGKHSEPGVEAARKRY